MSEILPAAPCKRCARTDGYVPTGSNRPSRAKGYCAKCYVAVRYNEKCLESGRNGASPQSLGETCKRCKHNGGEKDPETGIPWRIDGMCSTCIKSVTRRDLRRAAREDKRERARKARILTIVSTPKPIYDDNECQEDLAKLSVQQIWDEAKKISDGWDDKTRVQRWGVKTIGDAAHRRRTQPKPKPSLIQRAFNAWGTVREISMSGVMALVENQAKAREADKFSPRQRWGKRHGKQAKWNAPRPPGRNGQVNRLVATVPDCGVDQG